jgi:hypothetical protein
MRPSYPSGHERIPALRRLRSEAQAAYSGALR